METACSHLDHFLTEIANVTLGYVRALCGSKDLPESVLFIFLENYLSVLVDQQKKFSYKNCKWKDSCP